MSKIADLSKAQAAGTKLPFLTPGKSGAQYVLKLLQVKQWEVKKIPTAKEGDWRCQFQVEVVYSEGEGAAPAKTVCGILIMEDKKFGTYHLQEFRSVATAVLQSAGKNWEEGNTDNIEDLFNGKFTGTLFAAQLSPNADEKKAKFPIVAYFPMTEDVAEQARPGSQQVEETA